MERKIRPRMDELQIVIHLFLGYLFIAPEQLPHEREMASWSNMWGDEEIASRDLFLAPNLLVAFDSGWKGYGRQPLHQELLATHLSFFLSLQWTRLDAQHGVGSPSLSSWNLSLSFHQTVNGQAEGGEDEEKADNNAPELVTGTCRHQRGWIGLRVLTSVQRGDIMASIGR